MALNAILGDSEQNSYVTEDQATTYFSDRAFSQDWEEFEEKAKLLILSSSMIDWYVSFKGIKTVASQNMAWPRTGAIRSDGTTIGEAELPPEIKIAVYELALSSIEEDRSSDNPLTGIESLKAGPLSLKADIENFRSNKKKPIPEKVRNILSDITKTSGIGIVRLMRA